MDRNQQDRYFSAMGSLYHARNEMETLLEGSLTEKEREEIDEALDLTLKAIDAL